MWQQQNTLLHMLPRVKSGGKFVMEDLHTSFEICEYPRTYNPTQVKSTFELLSLLGKNDPNIIFGGFAISSEEVKIVNSFIRDVTIWFGPSGESVTSVITVK
jgi:hypothetical protein